MGLLSVVITFLLTYIAPIILAIYLYMKYTFNYWKNQGVPSTSPSTPFGDLAGIGTKYHLGEKTKIIYDEIKRQGQPRFGGMFSFLRPAVMVIDLELVKAVLVKDFSNFVNRSFFHNEKDDPLSANLLTLEGERWKRRRTFLSPAFSSGKLKAIFDIIDTKREGLIKFIERTNGKEFNAKDLSLKFFAEIVGATVFGIECYAMENDDRTLIELVEAAFGGDKPLEFLKFIFANIFPDVARKFKVTFTTPQVQKFTKELVKNAVDFRKKNNFESNDLLGMMITLMNKGTLDGKGPNPGESEPFTITNIAAESTIFFFGGFETRCVIVILKITFPSYRSIK